MQRPQMAIDVSFQIQTIPQIYVASSHGTAKEDSKDRTKKLYIQDLAGENLTHIQMGWMHLQQKKNSSKVIVAGL